MHLREPLRVCNWAIENGNRNRPSNNRLQPTQIALGTTPGGTDKLNLVFTYGGATNNGNVLSQTITVPGLSQPFIQNYTYDELNRLSSATETNNGSGTWSQIFGYDRYGNRNVTFVLLPRRQKLQFIDSKSHFYP